jgi:hypothetical protein
MILFRQIEKIMTYQTEMSNGHCLPVVLGEELKVVLALPD